MPSRKVKANEGLMRRSSRTPRQMENTEDLPQSSRKRKIFPSPSSEDRSRKQIKKTIDGRNMDSHCWICHELGQDELCSICCRVFHSSCLSKKLNFNNQKCPECQKNTIVGKEVCFTVSQDKLQRLLSYAVTQVYKSVNVPSCLWRWPSTEENAKLGQIIDGEILIDKLNGDKNHYKTVAAFYSDVKFLLHNSHILYGGNSNEVQGAKRLLKSFKSELMDIEACPECYENKISEVCFLPDFFSRICKNQHTIIWAKLKGFPYWPAKSLRIVEDAADVRFFGTHDKAFVPVNNCFLMSREYPTPKTPKQNKFLDAMKELNAYISRFNKEIGTFQFAAAKMAYETENVDCSNLSETIETDERDNSFTITGNDLVDDNTLLLTASENDLSEEFLDSCEGENTLSGGLLDVSEETEFPSLEVPAPLTYPTVTDVSSSSSYVEKEVHNQTFTPVSVSMTFSTDEEVQRSYESSYQSNAASLSVPATTDSTKSATAQNERNGNQNISVLASSDVAVLASPVVTGSQSLAVPASFMEQAFINYMSNDAHNELPHVYGINYNNLSQSQIAQNLQPTRFSLSLGSENDSIQEQGVISGSNTLCDNTFVNTVQAHGNYSNCVITNSSMDQSVPVNSSQAEFSIAGLCAEGDNNHEENALNQFGDESGEEIEFICETRGTVANTSNQIATPSRVERNLFHAMTSFDPKIKLLVNEHSIRMENFLIGAYRLLKALPEGGAAIAYLKAENESLKKTVSRLKQCVHYMEKRFKDHMKQSAERGYNAARVVKCFNNRSVKLCADKCDAIYREYDLKVKEMEKSLEKQYNENLESYERLVRSLESDKRRLKLQSLKLQVDVENFKTVVKTAEFQNNQLLEEIEKFKVNKETVELENKKLSEEIENHKINKEYEINAIIKEKIDSERLKWEQLKNEEVMEAKRADWCNVCLKSAVIHCCWNTNYCSNQCRQKHYEKHSRHCLNKESKKAPSASTASAGNRQKFTQRSNIQRSVTLMSSSSHHTSVMQAREFTFSTNSVTVPHEPTSSFMQERNASPLLPTPKKSCSKTLGTSRRKERNER